MADKVTDLKVESSFTTDRWAVFHAVLQATLDSMAEANATTTTAEFVFGERFGARLTIEVGLVDGAHELDDEDDLEDEDKPSVIVPWAQPDSARHDN